MKTSIFKTAIISCAILAVSSPYAMAGGKHSSGKWNKGSQQTVSNISTLEASSLKFMREEEKLARDVYMSLYNVWGTPVFKNISDSEQTHTTIIAGLLAKYGIEDPVKDDTMGVYNDPAFTELYNALVAYGSESFENALKVGSEIEELDIADLQEQLNVIKKRDITNAYNNLLKGSRNHLRSFYRLVLDAGFDYTPKHITQEEFDAIVTSDYETGNVNR